MAETEQDELTHFLADPSVRDALAYAIKKFPDLVEQKQQLTADLAAKTTATNDATDQREFRYAFLLLFGAMSLVLGTTILLALTGRISAEAVAFVIGSVTGSAFTFVSRFFKTE